ncbi:MAG: 1-aminocyclopropane-1-carboxylate deaminase [Flavobacteriaceae bacterium TMED212]|nr:MAG: 1-aminocyclopropane-1-carboxylate deaminase [Flavobacteriaceae bacterium TMED212]|tara:strand:+ start:7036 stop:7938 length:903 start_codon:yes stop_codon:yes gene_type:complete
MYLFKSQNSVNQFLTSINGFQITLKREDQLHPTVSGNKFRKLKYNLQQAKQEGHHTLLTFGGPYSNHLAATAAIGKIMRYKTIGMVRGDEERSMNPTMQFCKEQGMTLFPISRAEYRQKDKPSWRLSLQKKWGDFYLLPEGGTNSLAVKGCKEILTKEDVDFDIIACSIGTGGTLAGLIESALPHQELIGFTALKNLNIRDDIKKWTNKENWTLNNDYTFGGYAKITPELIDFINTFNKNFKTPLDPVYTGKLLFGIFDMIKNKKWLTAKKILVIHTGGLQGIEGMNLKLSKKKCFKITI